MDGGMKGTGKRWRSDRFKNWVTQKAAFVGLPF